MAGSDSESPNNMGRRDFLRFTAGAAAGAAATMAPEIGRRNEQHEKQEFYDTLKSITYEDLKNPESEKSRLFVGACAEEYARLTDYSDVDRLLQRTALYGTYESFAAGVVSKGGTAPKDESYGVFVLGSETVHINIDNIEHKAGEFSVYPGLKVFDSLAHEWTALSSHDRTEGRMLNNETEALIDAQGNRHKWVRYREASVVDDSGATGYIMFNNAMEQLIANRLLQESVSQDLELSQDLINTATLNGYYDRTLRLSKVVGEARISTGELVNMIRSSDFEGLLGRIGSAFDASVLEELSPAQKAGRTEEELSRDKDYLVGKRMAIIIDVKGWEEDGGAAYRGMLSHLKSRN